MFGYCVPPPGRAMLIFGGRSPETPPRVVTGHGAFVFFRRVEFLDLSTFFAEIGESCVSRQGIQLMVKAVVAARVGDDPGSIVNAAQRFLSDPGQMPTVTGHTVTGHLRSLIGSMTVEEIIAQRQTLATQVLTAAREDLARVGLSLDALQIQSIDDGDQGYIRAYRDRMLRGESGPASAAGPS